jgi:phospholipid/cholesterol/gamma-HCH transport system substrate-binding protein
MGERALELKVGAVLLAAIVVLGGFVLLLGDLGGPGGPRVLVDFAFSGAIQAGAPVKISGVKVGRVDELQFLGGTEGDGVQVRLVLRLEERARPALTQGARFYVNTQGLLGEYYVEIVPARAASAALALDQPVRGVDPPRFDLLVQKMYDLLDAASGLMESDDGRVSELIKSGASLAKTLDETLRENRGEVRRALIGAADAAEHASTVLAKADRALGAPERIDTIIGDVSRTTALVDRELPVAMKRVQSSLERLERLTQGLDKVDPADLTAAVAGAREATAQVNLLLADARTISARVRAGGGTVGRILQDDELYDDLKELVRDLKQNPWKLVWKQ